MAERNQVWMRAEAGALQGARRTELWRPGPGGQPAGAPRCFSPAVPS